jgi:hypothetical protein
MCNCGSEYCEYEERKLYWHEALHTSSLATDFFYDNVECHPAIKHDVEMKEAAEKVTMAMADFYQMVGRKSYDFDIKNGEA